MHPAQTNAVWHFHIAPLICSARSEAQRDVGDGLRTTAHLREERGLPGAAGAQQQHGVTVLAPTQHKVRTLGRIRSGCGLSVKAKQWRGGQQGDANGLEGGRTAKQTQQ